MRLMWFVVSFFVEKGDDLALGFYRLQYSHFSIGFTILFGYVIISVGVR